MKKTTVSRKYLKMILVFAILCMISATAAAYDAEEAQKWLEQFSHALSLQQPLNDPQQTADPARAGEYLHAYAFGTVTTQGSGRVTADNILQADIRDQSVMDCRGIRVGMRLSDALGERSVSRSSTQLYVLHADASGLGWAYVNEDGVYGVEYIAYGGEGAQMREYTLTYVVDRGVISAIRMKIAPATQAQAQDTLDTAREIASRQHGEILAVANDKPMFTALDVQMMGGAVLGADVADWVSRAGEPFEVQTLPDGGGRILLYDGAAVTLGLDEYTGVEIVRGVSVSGEGMKGPRGLEVGMTVAEAASLFRCDQDVSSLGGVLYLEGEALGEAPFGELTADGAGDVTLCYACIDDQGLIVVLQAGAQEGMLTHWRLFYERDMEDGK